jgi:hypothetical protein
MKKLHGQVQFFHFVGASTFLKKVRPGFEEVEYIFENVLI